MDQKMETKIKKPRSKATITIWILTGIILLVVAVGVFNYLRMQKQIKKVNEEIIASQVDTAFIKKGDLSEKLEDISGTVRPNQSVYLYWQISGTVTEVNVALGDPVK